MRMALRGAAAVVLAVSAVVAGGALAHEDMGKVPNTPAGKAVAARHQNYKQLGGAFKALTDELKKDTPDKAVIAASAAKMKALAGQIPSWFPKGSGPESGAKTDAKPDIWKDPNGFAAAGDLEAVKGQVRATGGACKNCHDKFRVPEKR